MTIDKKGDRLQAFCRGDEHAFRAYYEQYRKALCFFAFRTIKDEAVARDLVQEVFVNLWKSRAAITSDTHLRLFLYQALRHRCLNWFRDRKVEEEFREEYSRLVDDTDFADRVVEEEVQRIILQQIALLPSEQRRVVELHLAGKDNNEIAAIMQVSINTVRTHKARARKTLRERLDYLFVFLLVGIG